jgi:xanthine/uracil permease
VVWGLTVVALAALIIISRLGIVALNGTYVLIGLMIGAGAALIVGGLVSARRRDNKPTTGKS